MSQSQSRQHAQVERKIDVTWEGDLSSGNGTIVGGTSGAVANLPVSWPSRVEAPAGKTSPEELLAASHASCYAMALAYELTGRRTPPERLQVSANIGLDPKVGGGFEVSFSRLTVTGQVPGIDQTAFTEAARQAEQGCPISNALRGNVEILVDAKLA
jgi:osmotically inducible protein OsmC